MQQPVQVAPRDPQQPNGVLASREPAAPDLTAARPDSFASATLVVSQEDIVSACNRRAIILLGQNPIGALWPDIKSATSASPSAFTVFECERFASGARLVVLLEHAAPSNSERSSEPAAVLAHQLRTPLSAATLYVSRMVEAASTTDQHQQWLSRTLEQLAAAERMIGNLLMFSRDSAFATEALAVADVIAGVESSCEALLRRADMQSRFTIVTDDLPVLGNRVALVSALSNLVTNACQHAPGTTLFVHADLGDNQRAHIHVRDTGPGFPTGVDLFASHPADECAASGLGLAVARRVIEQHGGVMTASNHPDGGAQVRVELPLARCAAVSSVEVSI